MKNLIFLFLIATQFAFGQNVKNLESGFFDLDFKLQQEAQVGIDSFINITEATLQLSSFQENTNQFVLRFANTSQIQEDSKFIQDKSSPTHSYVAFQNAKNIKLVFNKTPVLTPEHKYIKQSHRGYLEFTNSNNGIVRVSTTCVTQGIPNRTFYCTGASWYKNSQPTRLLGDILISTSPKK